MKHYNSKPSSIPILFLPGWSFHSTIWERTAEKISGCTPIYRELPSLLETPKTDNELAATIINSFSDMPEQYVIAGWSLGGMLGALLATHYPDKILGLVTIACSPKFSAATGWHGVTQADAVNFQNQLMDHKESLLRQFRKLVSFPDIKKAFFTSLLNYGSPHQDLRSLNNLLGILINLDLRMSYKQLMQPAMHIYGLQDAIVPKQSANQMREHYPDHTVHSLDDAGHALILSHPEQLASHISHFIESMHAAY